MKSTRPLFIGLLALVGGIPLLCIGAVALTVALNLVGIIPDSALATSPKTPTPPGPTPAPILFLADPQPQRENDDSWALRVLSAHRLPTVDGLAAPAGQVWLVVKVRATMTDAIYKDSTRTLYNRHFQLRLADQQIAADQAACSAYDRGYRTGTFGNTFGTSIPYRESRDRTVIFAVPPTAERFELALQGYKARPIDFTLRLPPAP